MQSTEPNCRTKAVNGFFRKPLLVIRTLIFYSQSTSFLEWERTIALLGTDRFLWNGIALLSETLPEYESSVRFDPKDENHLWLGPYIQVSQDYLFAPQGRLFLGIVKMGWKGKEKKDHNDRPNWLNIIVRVHQPGYRFVCLMAACASSLSTLSHASGFLTDLLGLGWSTLHCFFARFVLTFGASKSILFGLALQCLIELVGLGSFLC